MNDTNYTPVSSIKSRINERKSSFSPYSLVLCCFCFVTFFLWQLFQMPFMQVFKSIAAGCFIVYYSWELIYFDSVQPGIQPPSPLSPQSIRDISGHILHLNYTMAVLIGAFFSLFVGWYC